MVETLQTMSAPINRIIESTVNTIPIIINASIILILGWIISKTMEKITKKLLYEVGVNEWEEKHNIKKALYGINLTNIITQSVKWYVFLIFINEAAVQLNLPIITQLIQKLIIALPNWVIGSTLIGIALIIGHKINEHMTKYKILFGDAGGKIAYFVITYFALVLALPKFGFTNTEILIDTFKLLVAGFSAGIAIAIGIGFGTALKQPAKKIIKEIIK